jgi:hypothetical protein
MTMRKLVQAAAMAGLLAGCGGGGSSKPLTETDFCNQKAEAECQVSDRCVTDKDACKADRMTVCTMFVADAKASGTRFFTEGNVSNCINKTKSVYAKTAPITPTDMNDVSDACNYVFQGKAKVTEACTLKWDCADKSHICDKMLCAPKVTKNSGDLCGNPGEICNTGSFCMMNGATYMCMARVASGMPCNTTMPPCLESLRCAAGTCADRVASAGSCSSNDDCISTAPFCDPYAGNKCDPGLSFAVGAPVCNDFGGSGSGPGTGGQGGTAGSTGTGGSGGAGGGSGGRGGGGGGGGAGGGSGGRGGGAGGSGGAGGLTGIGGIGGNLGTGGGGGA